MTRAGGHVPPASRQPVPQPTEEAASHQHCHRPGQQATWAPPGTFPDLPRGHQAQPSWCCPAQQPPPSGLVKCTSTQTKSDEIFGFFPKPLKCPEPHMTSGCLHLPASAVPSPPPGSPLGSLCQPASRDPCMWAAPSRGAPLPRACSSTLEVVGQGLGSAWPRRLPGNPTHHPGSSSWIHGPSPPSEATSLRGWRAGSWETGRRGGPGPYFPAAAGQGWFPVILSSWSPPFPKAGRKQPPFWERPSSPSPQPCTVSPSSRQVGSVCGNG